MTERSEMIRIPGKRANRICAFLSRQTSGNAGGQGAEARFILARSDIGLVHRVQGKEQTLAKNGPLLPLVRGNTSEQLAKAHVGICGTNRGR